MVDDTTALAEHPRNLKDRDFLLKAADAIIADGDMRGAAAKHSTTIWTRQVIEALASALRASAVRASTPPSDEHHKRCTICGFIVDTSFAAEKPTAEYTMQGRTKRGGSSPVNAGDSK